MCINIKKKRDIQIQLFKMNKSKSTDDEAKLNHEDWCIHLQLLGNRSRPDPAEAKIQQ